MGRVIVPIIFGVAAAGGMGLAWARSFAANEPARPSFLPGEETLAPRKGAKLMGNATCASMSCHNVNGPRGTLRSEYSTWATFDKHARAFQILYDDRSERIARNLYGEGAPAYEQQLCL